MMLNFCLQSIFREYGWQFFRRIAAPHPIRTFKAFLESGRLDISGDLITTFRPNDEIRNSHGKTSNPVDPDNRLDDRLLYDRLHDPDLRDRKTIIGVGFCLKPIDPPCPSGRANHNCQYLERMQRLESSSIPKSCRTCTIREIGILALETGASFYIMTSAQDILMDIFVPSLNEGRFSSGVFVLCRYSIRPFAVGLKASGIRGLMLPFTSGACDNYTTWLRADIGFKDDQTSISEYNLDRIRKLIGKTSTTSTTIPTSDPSSPKLFTKHGNILCP